MNDFFSRSREFSFKDLLAAIFSGFFIYKCGTGDLELVKILVPLIAIILGGYFGQEISSVWVGCKTYNQGAMLPYATGQSPPYNSKGDTNYV